VKQHPFPIKGLGKNQVAVLAALSDGKWHLSSALAGDGPPDHIRAAIAGLRGRSINIESELPGPARVKRHRLLPYPDKPWLPIDWIPDFVRMTTTDGFTEDEARQIIEDHVAVYARRAAA
jgi:hypothetical protein